LYFKIVTTNEYIIGSVKRHFVSGSATPTTFEQIIGIRSLGSICDTTGKTPAEAA
jgi:hypothetical protein